MAALGDLVDYLVVPVELLLEQLPAFVVLMFLAVGVGVPVPFLAFLEVGEPGMPSVKRGIRAALA